MSFEGSLKWIESVGGPLLLIEERLLDDWHGVFVKNSSVPESDYDRAWAIGDYIGLISVGSGFGIVLGDEPLPTTWLPSSQINDCLLVRWIFAENESFVIEALSSLRDIKWDSTGIDIQLSGDKLILFDAPCDGKHIDEGLIIEIPKGRYEVETFHYKPNNETSLMLHRFKAQ